MSTDSPFKANFSLTPGGPADRTLERIGLPIQSRRRIAVALLISWLPLLLLSALQGVAIGTTVQVPFLMDIAEQARLLLVMPLLLLAEPPIVSSVRKAVEQFLYQKLISEEDLPRFKAAVRQGMGWKESILAEAILVGIIVASTLVHLDAVRASNLSTWIMFPANGETVRSLAGWWFALVSMFIYRFLLFRWFWRFMIWAWFLWRVSRLHLKLIPTHPDKTGGLAFLGDTQTRFAILLFAMSAAVSASIANLCIYAGKDPLEFKFTILIYLVTTVMVVLLPLYVYAGHLVDLKENGRLEYSVLAMDCTQSFEQKWIQRDARGESLLSEQDFGSLADMGSSFEVVRTISIVPFDFNTIKFLVLAAILPFAPLVLIKIPLQEVLEKIQAFLL